MTRASRIFFLVVIATLLALALMNVLGDSPLLGETQRKVVDYPNFLHLIQTRAITRGRWQQNDFEGAYTDANEKSVEFRAEVPAFGDAAALPLLNELTEDHVPFAIVATPGSSVLPAVLGMISFPLVIFVLIYFLIVRPAAKASDLVGGRIAPGFFAKPFLVHFHLLSQEGVERTEAPLGSFRLQAMPVPMGQSGERGSGVSTFKINGTLYEVVQVYVDAETNEVHATVRSG